MPIKRRGYRKFFTRPPKKACPWKPRPKKKSKDGIMQLARLDTSGSQQETENTGFAVSYAAGLAHKEHNTEGDFFGFDVEPEPIGSSSCHQGQELFVNLGNSQSVDGIRVLSLFDGISTGLHVLQKIGIKVDMYFSSEIDECALSVQRFNYFGQIVQLGSVTDITPAVLDSLGRIDLVLGGSPCEEISLANWRRKGIHEKTSSGHLFFEFVRVLKYLLEKGKNNEKTLLWLLENTCAMEKSVKKEINSHLKCEPVVRCSSAYVPMKRRRNFWGNIPMLHEKRDTTSKTQLTLQDFLKPYRKANILTLPTLTTTSHSQRSGRGKLFPVTEAGKGVLLYISEIELLFGFPLHFTAVSNLSISNRRKALGKAWVVPVIEDILQELKFQFPLLK